MGRKFYKNTKNSSLYSQRLLSFIKQDGHDGPEIAHLSLLTKHAPSSFPVT